jgi:HEAT repeat protein
VISTDDLEVPVSLRSDAGLRGEVEDAAPDSIPTHDLMTICQRYWSNLAQGSGAIDQESWRALRVRYNEYVRAVNALGNRGPEVRDWARGLLVRPEYDARETGAWLLGELGRKEQLGEMIETVIDELGALIDRPFEDDFPKEAQAIDAAIVALGKIGHLKGVPVLRHVLFSTLKEHQGDTQWEAAGSLAKRVGGSFMKADDPVCAARAWLLELESGAHEFS